MSDVLSADTTDVVAVDTTNVLAADTADVLSADATDVMSAHATFVKASSHLSRQVHIFQVIFTFRILGYSSFFQSSGAGRALVRRGRAS